MLLNVLFHLCFVYLRKTFQELYYLHNEYLMIPSFYCRKIVYSLLESLWDTTPTTSKILYLLWMDTIRHTPTISTYEYLNRAQIYYLQNLRIINYKYFTSCFINFKEQRCLLEQINKAFIRGFHGDHSC